MMFKEAYACGDNFLKSFRVYKYPLAIRAVLPDGLKQLPGTPACKITRQRNMQVACAMTGNDTKVFTRICFFHFPPFRF
ncbi:hypothetical protein [Desulfosalsimonas propionicica]|uniref:hypothetical protein n=1 Tax=Desulfosalsimonas propionicica TaxID=332175 RepID=UPI0015EB57B3|nr:hypothetical protein [Desulfosalsimonas propionicica]